MLRGAMLRGAYSFVACLSPLTIDHASLSRRRTCYGWGAGGGGDFSFRFLGVNRAGNSHVPVRFKAFALFYLFLRT